MNIIQFPGRSRATIMGEFKELMGESVKYPIPLYVIKLAAISVAAISCLLFIVFDISADQVIKKILVILFLCSFVTYYFLLLVFYAEKRWRFLSKSL